MTQQERQERSREKIYRAALEEFGASGYDAVNMEQICGKHGISKGMMYHYYSSKDQLFLLCVERTFADLNACIEQEAEKWADQDILETFKAQLLMREAFFNCHPLQKTVFETAVLRPPKGLAKQIRELYAPIREKNQRFLQELLVRMPLRPGISQEKAVRFLGGVEYFLQYYQRGQPEQNLHSILETAEDVFYMAAYGVFQPPAGPAFSSCSPASIVCATRTWGSCPCPCISGLSC